MLNYMKKSYVILVSLKNTDRENLDVERVEKQSQSKKKSNMLGETSGSSGSERIYQNPIGSRRIRRFRISLFPLDKMYFQLILRTFSWNTVTRFLSINLDLIAGIKVRSRPVTMIGTTNLEIFVSPPINPMTVVMVRIILPWPIYFAIQLSGRHSSKYFSYDVWLIHSSTIELETISNSDESKRYRVECGSNTILDTLRVRFNLSCNSFKQPMSKKHLRSLCNTAETT